MGFMPLIHIDSLYIFELSKTIAQATRKYFLQTLTLKNYKSIILKLTHTLIRDNW